MHVGALSSCLSVHQYVYLVPSDDIRSPGTELQIVGCKPPCGHWEQNLGPLVFYLSILCIYVLIIYYVLIMYYVLCIIYYVLIMY